MISMSSFSQQNGLTWLKHIKSSSANLEIEVSAKLDHENNTIVAGNFTGTFDFDPSNATFNLTSAGQRDIFILKLDSLGNFMWAKQIGNSFSNYFRAMNVDDRGNIICLGDFSDSLDLDPGLGLDQVYSNSIGSSIFIVKLGKNGMYKWGKKIEGRYNTSANGTISDGNGNVYSSGYFVDTVDFDPGISKYVMNGNAIQTGYIQKLDSNGKFIWARKFDKVSTASTSRVNIRGMQLNTFGELLVTGHFFNTINFDAFNPGAVLSPMAAQDGFIMKMSPIGNLMWVKQFSGSNDVIPAGIDLNSSNEMIIPIHFDGSTDFNPDTGVYILTPPALPRKAIAFVKLNTNGNLVWVKKLTSSGSNNQVISKFDAAGNVINFGLFTDTLDMDLEATSTYNLVTPGDFNSYIQKLDQNGNFISASQIFGYCIPESNSIQGNKMVLSGNFRQLVNFDSSSTAFSLSATLNSKGGYIAHYLLNNSTTSLSENNLEQREYSIYPNPSNCQVNIEFTNRVPQKIIVYDSQGKIVKSFDNFKDRMMLSLARGIYFIQMRYVDGIFVEKIIIN